MVAKLESVTGVLPVISIDRSCGFVMANLQSVELCMLEQLLSFTDSKVPEVMYFAISYTESSVLGEYVSS